MSRKSILYRRLWYVRKRNTGRIHVILRLLAALLILTSLFLLFSYAIMPRLRQAAEFDIREAYVTALREAASKVFSYGQGYKNMVVFESAPDGSISALSLDMARLDELTEELLSATDKKLGLPDDGKVRVSMTDSESSVYTTDGIFDFDVLIMQEARPVINYTSEYIPINEGQTRMRVNLVAETLLNYRGSFLEGNTEVSAEMPVAEFVILGKLPDN